MNRRQKIIVSVTGIFIVLLILVGLTYAYFLTRIQGNTNDKSISVTTANLAVVYGDGNGVITAEKIQPGKVLDTKTFTVTNEGNEKTEYVVIVEDAVIKDLSDNSTTAFQSNDFVYTLTCTNCDNEVEDYTTLPLKENILVGNEIDVGVTQEYTLTVMYKETGIDQFSDMNKSMETKVNIANIKEINPYSDNTNSLAYNIINNAALNKNGTELLSSPKTKVAQEISAEDESILSITQDDYGTSYYYRGNVKNNYVNFAGMCWRIVRIEGDGSTKLILEDINEECNSTSYIGNWWDGTDIVFGYDSNYRANFLNYTGGLADALKNFQITKLSGVLNKLKVDEWCYDDTITKTDENSGYEFYGAFTRIDTNKKPSLICTGTKLTKYRNNTNMYVGTLTADEIAFAGGKDSSDNSNYYLINDYQTNNSYPLVFWVLSPGSFLGTDNGDTVFSINRFGNLGDFSVIASYALRSAVSLASGTQINGGNGTLNSPYIIG